MCVFNITQNTDGHSLIQKPSKNVLLYKVLTL
jgi:hypothetical protein